MSFGEVGSRDWVMNDGMDGRNGDGAGDRRSVGGDEEGPGLTGSGPSWLALLPQWVLVIMRTLCVRCLSVARLSLRRRCEMVSRSVALVSL